MSDKASKDNCSGDYPAVWRFTYNYNQQIRRSVPFTGETEKIGEQRVQQFYDVIAITPELARAAYDKEFGWKFKKPIQPPDRDDANYDKHELVAGPDFVCYVDAFIEVYRK